MLVNARFALQAAYTSQGKQLGNAASTELRVITKNEIRSLQLYQTKGESNECSGTSLPRNIFEFQIMQAQTRNVQGSGNK